MNRDEALTSAIIGLANTISVLAWQLEGATGENTEEVRRWAGEITDLALNGGKP